MLTDEQKTNWKANRGLSTQEVIAKLPDDIRPAAYIVGVWVWLQFDKKPDAGNLAAIKELGFKWNRKRQAWQHPCGCYRPAAPYDR